MTRREKTDGDVGLRPPARRAASVRTLGTRCFARAAASLGRMLGRRVRVVRGATVEPAARALLALAEHAKSRPMVGLRSRIEGAGAGWILMLFPATAAWHILHALMAVPPVSRPLTAMERSAVQEVGNVLASSFLSELGDLAGRRFFPSPPEIRLDDVPQMVREVGASIQTRDGELLALQARLEDRARQVEGRIVVLSDAGALEAAARGAPVAQEIPQ